MSSNDYFDSALGQQYFISAVIFSLLSLLTLKVALEQKERNRNAQCYVVLLLFCGSLCRTVWLFVKPTADTAGLAVCNRLGILFQFTAILWMIYLWWVVLNVCKEYTHHFIRALIVFCWIFLLITAMYCYGSHCLMYMISLVFIAFLSLVIVASVLIHGLVISEQLSQRKSDVSDQLQLQRKCLKELQFVCTVIMFCFVLRAFCFCIHPFHHWFDTADVSWSDYFYPWAFYQVSLSVVSRFI